VNVAFLFPGQGAQSVGMGRTLAEQFPAAREVFETADRVLGFALSRICWDGPAEELRKTVHTQPALLTHSVAALRLVQAAGIRPAWTAGHSLGEYSACVAAGALGFEDAVRLVHRRGALMHEAGLERPGTMAAILGMSPEAVEAVCEEASAAGVVRPANMNAPGQVAISGEIPAVERACELARARGAKRAIRLEVGGAFHSPLMASAAAGLAEWIDRSPFRDAGCPIVLNVSAEPVTRADDIRAALKAQLLAAVRWEDSMRLLVARGAEGFVEIGSGRVLRGLLRATAPEARAWNVEDPESLHATLAAMGAGRMPAAGRI
jgi:[acyl-carrier-protein] S-malonyltransferase